MVAKVKTRSIKERARREEREIEEREEREGEREKRRERMCVCLLNKFMTFKPPFLSCW